MLASVLSAAAAPMGAAWVLLRRREYRRIGRGPSDAERGRLRGYFDEELLGRVRVAEVEFVRNPAVYAWMGRVGVRPPMELTTVLGMAFGDAVVVSPAALNGMDSVSLLFHEMVHVVQYEVLGVRGFVRDYVRGWLESGRDYFAIPMEVEAHELQRRFERGERFRVEEEVRRR